MAKILQFPTPKNVQTMEVKAGKLLYMPKPAIAVNVPFTQGDIRLWF